MSTIDINKLADFCRRELGLESAKLSDEYGYGSLPLCVIDAVFSIGVRYEGVRNVIARYCDFFGLTWNAGDQQNVQQMLDEYRHRGVDFFTANVYANKQRTSTRNGILKSEAVFHFASALNAHGVDVMKDVPKLYEDSAFESEIRSIPGQSSGLSLRYFFMLSGNDDFVKPDRMITRFLQRVLGRAVSMEEAQILISSACRSLKSDFPRLTPRLLDHAIWNYERDNGKTVTPARNVTTTIPQLARTPDEKQLSLFTTARTQRIQREGVIIERESLTKDQYYPFFQTISTEMRRILPAGLDDFADRTEEGKNWMRIRYPSKISNGLYELQCASRSKNFANHFGDGSGIFLSFYKGGQREQLERWLAQIVPIKSQLEAQLGQDVKITLWSAQWAFVGIRLDESTYATQATAYAKSFTQFIQATFNAVCNADLK